MHQFHTKSMCSKNKTNHKNQQKHNSMTIYCKSMWLLLLPFRYKFGNARLHLGKCHFHIIFATKSVPFLNFIVYYRKGLLAQIRCNKQFEYLKGNKVWYDLVTPNRWERCCSEELLLKLALLNNVQSQQPQVDYWAHQAAQISKLSNVAWSAATSFITAECDVTNNTSSLNFFCVTHFY